MQLEHTFAQQVPSLSVQWQAMRVTEPELVALNEPLAADLGLDADWLRSPAGLSFLTGQDLELTFAQGYAGHQFGNLVPQLGDGRALLIGELVHDGQRHDLHLKGSGRTPFSRGGDGLAALGPMLRELIISESLHALGVPTTRSLAVVATGQRVRREQDLPGAILCRVASSHLRVGSFQYAALTGAAPTVRLLTEYALHRHFPELVDAPNPGLALLDEVATRQSELVARWMNIGFIHGVMNTDNMTISGESIDFGPCAFMDRFNPLTVFSSIDRQGRYAYANQPPIAQWNLARLAETLLPIIADDADHAVAQAMEIITDFPRRYADAHHRGVARKLGLAGVDTELHDDLLTLLEQQQVDYTGFFVALAGDRADELFTDPEPFRAWRERWLAASPDRGALHNPVVIPRNHRVEEALDAATAGDLAPFERLLEAVRRPFEARAGEEDLWTPAPPDAPRHITYCGT